MLSSKPKRERLRTIKIGDRHMVTRGIPHDFWRDLYHNSMNASWPLFILGIAVIFIVVNVFFAGLFALGGDPVANVPPGSFAHYFYFSIETLATVGYGDLHPQTHYGHIIASCEMFCGLLFAAVITGLIFARFARPRARFLFADVATFSIHDGQQTLSIRVANARLNLVVNATAKLWLVRNETSAEGKTFRRFHELALIKRENPIFSLSWSIFHVIDSSSLLWDVGPEIFKSLEAMLILSIQGRDDNFAQEVFARRTYGGAALRWNAVYSDIIDVKDDGRILINYHRFHDTEDQQ